MQLRLADSLPTGGPLRTKLVKTSLVVRSLIHFMRLHTYLHCGTTLVYVVKCTTTIFYHDHHLVPQVLLHQTGVFGCIFIPLLVQLLQLQNGSPSALLPFCCTTHTCKNGISASDMSPSAVYFSLYIYIYKLIQGSSCCFGGNYCTFSFYFAASWVQSVNRKQLALLTSLLSIALLI